MREYVEKWDLDRSFAMSDLVHAWCDTLLAKVPDPDRRYLLGMVLFDFDIPGMELMRRENIPPGPEAYEMIRQLRHDTFENLMRSMVNAMAVLEGEVEE